MTGQHDTIGQVAARVKLAGKVKGTARRCMTTGTPPPSCAVTCVSARPLSARPLLLFHPLPTGFAPVYGTKWSSTWYTLT